MMLTHRRIRLAAITGCAVVAFPLSVPLAAQDGAADPYEPCSLIADGDARLACFDRTFAEQKATSAARADAQAVRRAEDFGLTATQREELDEERAQEAADLAARGDLAGAAAVAPDLSDDYEVSASVVEVFTDGGRRQVIVLDNGQIWREKSNNTIRRGVREGDSVVISDDRFGYFLRAEGRSGKMSVGRMR